MQRTDWEFSYTASDLAKAATLKRDEHQRRYDWWTEQKAKVMQKVKESGIEVHDSVAASISNTKGGFGPRIEIDGGLQRDLCECQDKIVEHNKAVKDYDGWRQVLEANPQERLQLNHDDWLYFFGQ